MKYRLYSKSWRFLLLLIFLLILETIDHVLTS